MKRTVSLIAIFIFLITFSSDANVNQIGLFLKYTGNQGDSKIGTTDLSKPSINAVTLGSFTDEYYRYYDGARTANDINFVSPPYFSNTISTTVSGN